MLALCQGLGVELPAGPGDVGGVEALYRAWSAAVPFDPVAKAIAVGEGADPPGADAVEVAQRWLTTGAGSTCWGHVTVLGALLAAAGVASSVGLDRLQRADGVVDFHAFVVVELDGSLVALDPIHPSGAPLPLVPGARGTHPAYATGIDADGPSRLAHTFHQPDRGERASRYALLSTYLDADDVAAFCRVSGRFSGVTSRRFFLRRASADAFTSARPERDGSALVVETWRADGVERSRYEDVDEALATVGYHGDARAMVERAGFLCRDGSGGGWRWCEQELAPDRYGAAGTGR